jgi:hypothetical protein
MICTISVFASIRGATLISSQMERNTDDLYDICVHFYPWGDTGFLTDGKEHG